MKNLIIGIICLLMYSTQGCTQQTTSTEQQPSASIRTGAEQTEKYLPELQGKRVAIMANPTSIIGETHLVDSLLSLKIDIVKVFAAEHGFRGEASAGVKIEDGIDKSTGVPVVSLYGKKSKPTPKDLSDVDVVIYDLQDVGVRFYTNINALVRLMEACEANAKKLIIFDRPNPNGYLIDGPVLDMKYKSGIGMFPLPMSHGLTVGEFAQMANGEGWLSNGAKCNVEIIPVENYAHNMPYELPVKPSPNLNTQQSVMLYPSTCMFEAVYVNHGRGTYYPFTVLGSPELKGIYDFSFTPTGIPGMSEMPIFKDEVCYGIDLREVDIDSLRKSKRINLKWIMELYRTHPNKEKFFDSRLSNQMNRIEQQIGSGLFRNQIINGASEKEIRASWEPGLSEYKKMREKYLIYP